MEHTKIMYVEVRVYVCSMSRISLTFSRKRIAGSLINVHEDTRYSKRKLIYFAI